MDRKPVGGSILCNSSSGLRAAWFWAFLLMAQISVAEVSVEVNPAPESAAAESERGMCSTQ